MKIGTIRGAPSDRVLTREIKAAEIVRIPLSPTIAADAADLLRSGKADIFGADSGVGYPAAEALPGAKIVPGAFAMVRVAAALPKDRSAAAQAALATLVDEAKQSGVVQKAIDAKGLKGVNVATKLRDTTGPAVSAPAGRTVHPAQHCRTPIVVPRELR